MGSFVIWQIIGPLFSYFGEKLYELYYLIFKRRNTQRILKKVNPYYTKLPPQNRLAFEMRTWVLMTNTHYVVRDDFNLTTQLKVIIGSYAAQISINLPDECFDYYDKIILYKDYYPSRLTGKNHKAEVNPGLQIIVFSLRAIYESIAQSRDGINVLLHEFAHALRLEHKLMQHEYKIFDDYALATVDFLASAEIERMKENEHHIFRKYASTNLEEFFAVAVENFFERPREFKEALPELYTAITKLLKQDTLKLQTT